MKNKKAFALVMMAVATTLAACGKDQSTSKESGTESKTTSEAGKEEQEDEQVHLRISWWGSDARHEATLDALDLFMQKYPNIKVSAEYQGFDGYHDKLMTQVSSGTEPDIYQLDNNVYFSGLAANDKLGDLEPYIGKELKLDDYPETALVWAQYDGKQYGVPSGLNGQVLAYNKKIFDEAGVSYPTDEWSWDDFEKACQEIYDKTGKFGMTEPSYFVTETIMRQNGQWLATEQGELQDFSNALADVFEIYNQWRETGILPPLELTVGQESQQDNLFLSCEAACQIFPIATLPMNHAAMTEEVELGIALMPGTEEKGGSYMLASMPWTLGKSSKHPKEAVMLIDFLINDPEAAEILMTVRGVPAPTSVREAITSKLSGDDELVIEGVDRLVECTERIDYEWLVPGTATLESTIQKGQYSSGYGESTSEDAAKEVYETVLESVNNAK